MIGEVDGYDWVKIRQSDGFESFIKSSFFKEIEQQPQTQTQTQMQTQETATETPSETTTQPQQETQTQQETQPFVDDSSEDFVLPEGAEPIEGRPGSYSDPTGGVIVAQGTAEALGFK